MKTVIKAFVITSLTLVATLLVIGLLPRSIAYLHIKTTPCGAMVQFNAQRITLTASPCRVLAAE